MQGFLEKHVGPIAHKVSSFKVVKGLMSGMMATMPVTLGVALLSIINGLPIPPLQAFLTGTGMSATIADVLVVTHEPRCHLHVRFGFVLLRQGA